MKSHVTSYFKALVFFGAVIWGAPSVQALPIITQVVETGGDGPPTAQFTGQTFTGPNIGTYTVPLFGVLAKSMADRVHAYTNASGTVLIPSYLNGQEYIMIRNDNRDNASLRLDVTVSSGVRVYLLIDNRLSDGANANPPTFDPTHMQWVLDEGWTPVITGVNRLGSMSVPDEVGIDESVDGSINQWFSVYSKTFPAGTFQLKQADNAGRNMYGVVVAAADPPSTPTNLVAVSGDNRVTLTWAAAAGAASYNIKRQDIPGDPFVTIATTTSTTYVDLTAVNGGTYVYVVSAVNGIGESPDSAQAIGQPQAAPQNVQAAGGAGQIVVSWDALAGAASYNVLRASVSGGPYTPVATGIAGTTYTDMGLAEGTRYYYVVLGAWQGGGLSGQSLEAAGVTLPGAPSLTVTTWATTVNQLRWSLANPVVTQFLIEKSTDGETFTALATVELTNRFHLDTGLTPGSTTFYRIQAANAAGLSPYSAVASNTTPASGWNVNFANSAAPVPPGYVQDIGELFGDRGNGLFYGWSTPGGTNITVDARFRQNTGSPDLRYDTFNHLMKSAGGVPSAGATWEIEIPNGYYFVHLVAGDITAVDSTFQFDIEGVQTDTYVPVAGANFGEFADYVIVRDGRLTVNSGPSAANNKINFIDIYPAIPVPIVIGTNPQPATVLENRSVTLSVVISAGSRPISYQWYKDGVELAGQTASTLSIPLAQLSDDGTYHVVVANYAGTETSATARLTVLPDNVPPVLVSAASYDGLTIGLCFDELLDPAAAADAVNYGVQAAAGASGVLSATLQPDGKSVLLRLDAQQPLSGAFTVSADMQDLKQNSVQGLTANGNFLGFATADLGQGGLDPVLAGSHFSCTNPIVRVTGGGSDIWGTNDHGHFLFRDVSGDFDARVQVQDLRGANAIAKALLMVREGLDAGSRTLHISVNPLPPGRNLIEAGMRTNANGLTGPWSPNNTYSPADIPNAHLRITRIGDVFTAYRSSNGVDWIQFNQVTVTYPPSVLVGLAVTAHDNAQSATATFANFQLAGQCEAVTISNVRHIAGPPSQIEFQFPSAAGCNYELQYKDALTEAQWNTLRTIPGTGGVVTIAEPATQTERFYRIRIP